MNTENYCVAGRLRMLSRMVTGLYNEAFSAEGVTFAQAGLLMYIVAQPGIRQVVLGKQLHIEKSAISRDVQLLQRNGWITDNVRKGLYLTETGTQTAKRCYKIWKALNQQVREQLGAEAINGLSAVSEKLNVLAKPLKN